MKKRVLIVDDAEFMRMSMKKTLTENGFEVAGEAEDGHGAIEKYRECLPDLVIMDVTMPDMDGLEALKIIKSEFPDAKLILCSAMGHKAVVVEAIRSGAATFMVKPFCADLLVKTIRKVLAQE